MLFNSLEFLLFFPAVLLGARMLSGRRREAWLLAASYFFYMWWSVPLASLLAISSVVDFWVGRGLKREERQARRKLLLFVSVSVNLGMLVFFKYTHFLLEAGTDLLAVVGIVRDAPHLDIILPLGISFYTFQTMSYTIDVYRRRLEPTDSFLRFSLYVAFFPQLVAGPIVRASDLLPQFARGPIYSDQRNREGVFLIATGFIKKMVLADHLAPYVNAIYSAPDAHGGGALLLATYAFAFQIYLDFSGYTDIARGAARLLGFDIGINFAKPYFSQSITEFWRRWHISLSSWLRDYLYISLGGNRVGRFNTYRNLMLTMLLGGIWHGAAWTFVWWGVLHGALLMMERVVPMHRILPGEGWVSGVIRRVVTFHLVCVSWVLFRAESMGHALDVLTGIFVNPWDLEWTADAAVVAGLILFSLGMLMADVGDRVFRGVVGAPRPLRWAAALSAALLVIGFGVWSRAEFIYFQF